jgi:hypothetical protein
MKLFYYIIILVIGFGIKAVADNTNTAMHTRMEGMLLALIGFIVLGLALRGVFTGTAQIAFHLRLQKYSRKKEPIGFWLVTAFEMFGGILFIVVGLK